ncbi:MAG: class I SAM-dependent methyltransferase [Bacteroidetes bacterium]|nr:class I SAM-dependent methyltransferase [Bacteroidota bacterium]
MKLFLVYLWAALALGACGHQTAHNKAQEFMHQADFDELVARFEDPQRREWQKVEQVIEAMGLSATDVVADIGAGTGYFTFPLAQVCQKVIAIDIEPRFLEHIERKKESLGITNIETRLTKAHLPAIEKGECTKVLIVNTIHHIDKVAKYLSKVRDNLRLGGSVVIVDFKEGDIPVGPPQDLRMPLPELKRQLGLAGFTRLVVDDNLLPHQYVVTAY